MPIQDITSISDICQLAKEGFTDWEKYGEVVTDEDDGLILFNYKREAQYANRWNFFERVSRGLIVDRYTGEVVARPFDKFFNWCELEDKPKGKPLFVTEKVDGSMGTLYRHKGMYRIATRGAFHSEQAEWATEFLNGDDRFDLAGLPHELTLILEIVYPDNRIVVDYGDRVDLVLLAARNRFTGSYVPFWHETEWLDVEYLARNHGFSLPRRYHFSDIDAILPLLETMGDNEEGFVVEFEGGERCKFKGKKYLELHRLISNLSYKNTLDAMASGQVEIVMASLPDEFQEQFAAWVVDITIRKAAEKDRLLDIYLRAPRGDRKEYAMWVQQNHKTDAHYLFALRDGKPIEPMIYKAMKEKTQQEVS